MRNFSLLARRKARGQGMTEYIIIVALIAIAAIGVYSAFGNVIRGQTGAMAAELGGKDGSVSANNAGQAATKANTKGQEAANLGNFQEKAAAQR
jgi:Flp pilus assembly pilin Flp